MGAGDDLDAGRQVYPAADPDPVRPVDEAADAYEGTTADFTLPGAEKAFAEYRDLAADPETGQPEKQFPELYWYDR